MLMTFAFALGLFLQMNNPRESITVGKNSKQVDWYESSNSNKVPQNLCLHRIEKPSETIWEA